MHSSRADHRAGRRSLAALALAPAVLLALAACGQDSVPPQPVATGTAGPVGVGGSGDAGAVSPSTTSGSGSADPTGDGSGCPKTKAAAPGDAVPAEVGDLDGDGARDELWFSRDGSDRVLGVQTASGAAFSTTFESASPISAGAVANRLGDDSAIILLSTGRSAALYAVVDCEIVPTEDVKGEQYTFDLGVGGYGTGVACPTAKGTLFLAGYKTEDTGKPGYKNIIRTKIDLSENGTRADNGTIADLGEHAENTPSYQIAEGVSCGDSATATEPQS